MKTTTVLPLWLLSFVCLAQNPVVPGAIQTKLIRDETSQMIGYACKDTTRIEIGGVTNRFVVTKPTLTVITQVEMKGMPAPWVDTTVADAKNLRPVRCIIRRTMPSVLWSCTLVSI